MRGDDCDAQSQKISIHAPPRGATKPPFADFSARLFQFTPLREGRLDAGKDIDEIARFQFTPLREGRQVVNRAVEASADFNSRPSARGDGASSIVKALASYFNSRPSARGDGGFPAPVPRHSFQFTPLREGRRIVQSSLVNRNRFQFTPLREGRRCKWYNSVASGYFNSRPSARGDAPRFQFCPAA